MNLRTFLSVSLLLVSLGACSGGGKGGAGGSAGSSSGGGGGHGGSAGGTGGAVGAHTGGVSGDAGCNLDAAPSGCFSHGSWEINNLSPCFFSLSADANTSGAVSTIESGSQVSCPSDFTTAPTQPWSTDTLTTDCAGHYRLCYTLKAGSGASPQPTDCIVAQSCAEGDYATANQPQTWADLPGWISTGTQVACAMTFNDSGGYGEKSVTGTPTGCFAITKTIGTVTYCPPSCNQPNPPSSCTGCVSGATVGF
jgi:hypothetical protein